MTAGPTARRSTVALLAALAAITVIGACGRPPTNQVGTSPLRGSALPAAAATPGSSPGGTGPATPADPSTGPTTTKAPTGPTTPTTKAGPTTTKRPTGPPSGAPECVSYRKFRLVAFAAPFAGDDKATATVDLVDAAASELTRLVPDHRAAIEVVAQNLRDKSRPGATPSPDSAEVTAAKAELTSWFETTCGS